METHLKNDTLEAHVTLKCSTCRSYAIHKKIELISERKCHIICSQCGYEAVSVTIRFEETNFGVLLDHKPSWNEKYSDPVYVAYGQILFLSLSGHAEVTITIEPKP